MEKKTVKKNSPLKAVRKSAAKKKVSKKKIEEAIIVDKLTKFYVKQPNMKSTFIEVFGVSKFDVSMDYAGYSFDEDEKPQLKVCKEVYTRAEMVKMGYFPSVKEILKGE